MSTYPTIAISKETVAPGVAYGVGTAWFNRADPDAVNRELVDAVKLALSVGFTHLDNAQAYGNEQSVGVAISESGLPRESLFITTKVSKGLGDIRASVVNQLKLLKTNYIDLYLIHWPYDFDTPGYPSNEDAWKQMEAVKEEGLVKEIGVSNYRISDLEKTLAIAKHRPVVNQIELHPYLYKEAEELLQFMKKEGITAAAYAPTAPLNKAPGGPLDPVLDKIAAAVSERAGTKVVPSQVLLKLAAQRGFIVVTTSGKEWRMKEQLAAGGIPDLTPSEIEEIAKTGATKYQRFFMQHMSKL